MEQLRVLLVENDPIARTAIVAHLEHAGVVVQSLSNGTQAMLLLRRQQFDVLVTELHLCDGSGIAIMAAARSQDSEIELIAMTSTGSLDSALAAISHGVFDYVQKPAVPELLVQKVLTAGMRCQSRRQLRHFYQHLNKHLSSLSQPGNSAMPTTLRESAAAYQRSFGPLLIDSNRRVVICAERRSELSDGEMKLLLYLMDHGERVIGVRQIVRDVFGYECTQTEARDLVKARVHMLRRKIEPDPRTPQLLVSVRGAGYVLTTQSFQ